MIKPCIISLLALVIVLGGCGKKEQQITTLKMLEGGNTFAVPTGTAADQMVLKRFPDAKLEYYNSVLDCALAVRDGKADATAYDKPILKNIAAKNPGLTVLDEVIMDDRYGFAVTLENPELKKAIDEVLAEIKKDGTYDAMSRRWFPDKGSPAPMPLIQNDGKNGELRFGTAAVTEPMSFFDANRQIAGFDIEFASYIARKLGKKLVITDMDFGAMIPSLISGKVDMVGAGLSITEERAKKVLFSEPYYLGGLAVAVKGNASPSKAEAIANKKGLMKNVGDISDKRIGVLLGSIHDAYATKNYPKAQILEYQNLSDMLFALNSGKTDVAFMDQTALRDIFSKNPGLGALDESVFNVSIAAGFNKENDVLRQKFNTFLEEIRTNGVYKDMHNRWMDQGLTTMPEIPHPAKISGVLKPGIVSDLGLPISVIKDGQLIGFDIELGKRFAAYLGMDYEPVDLPFGSLLASVSTNKVDLITSSLMITDERKKQIDFSDPYNESGVSVIAPKKNLAAYAGEMLSADNRTFIQKVKDSFYANIILEKRYLHIINGLEITIIISILSAILGTLIGALICWMRMSKNRTLSGTAGVYITILRGMPVLVLLMMIYYVIFASVNINPVVVAVIAFGMNFGAYVSEMFRTSIQGIDKGQKEAAIAGGFRNFQAFRFIIIPQALRSILPVYKGEFISMVKMTSVVGYIAVQDLTKASDIIRSRTFDAFFPLFMVAILYFIIAYLLARGLDLIEVSADPRKRHSNRRKEARS
jgi:polar amino acid transport system substrate-binding protein